MNKVIISRLTIMMLMSMFVVMVSQAQQSESQLTNTATGFALSNWYACNYGDYEPACEAVDDTAPSDVSMANVNSNALSNWYACNYGDYEPACETINDRSNSNNIT